jgi:hypothetical protein
LIGYKSAVFSADTSGCQSLGGNLKKKNSHGIWQTRYFYLNNDFIIYKKDSGSSAEIKGVIDLGEMRTMVVTPKGDITLVMNGGEELYLKGSDGRDAGRWKVAVDERMKWIENERQLIEAAKEAALENPVAPATPLVSYKGWLMKKSPHKYGGMQVFINFQPKFLSDFVNASLLLLSFAHTHQTPTLTYIGKICENRK